MAVLAPMVVALAGIVGLTSCRPGSDCDPTVYHPGADLSGTNQDGKQLTHCDLSGIDFTSASFDETDLAFSDLRDANLEEASISSADLRGADLTRATLHHARLTDSTLDFANLASADLTATDFEFDSLRGTDLSGTDLTGAYLNQLTSSGVRGQPRLDPPNVVVDGYLLSRGARLRGADLSGADLRYGIPSRMDLRDADLRAADFRHSVLVAIDLTGADVTGADFRDADISVTTGPANGTSRYALFDKLTVCPGPVPHPPSGTCAGAGDGW